MIFILLATTLYSAAAALPSGSDSPPLQLPAALRHPMMPPASSLVPRDPAGLLATLLQPIKATEFMDTYYERTSLHVTRNNKPDYFAELRKATMESFDPMLAAFRDANVLSRGIQVRARENGG
jgi:hypothetical protein